MPWRDRLLAAIAEQGDPALAFKREYHDIDLVVSRKQRRAIGERLIAAGLRPVESFNAVQGETRLMFADGPTESVIDVFLGIFSMCHEVTLSDEAFNPVGHPSLDLVELCLTKLQVVECNEKDLRDVAGLLAFHELGDGPERLDAVRLSDRPRATGDCGALSLGILSVSANSRRLARSR